LLGRVLTPKAIFPQGVTGRARPIGERPSPPPCGWSQGFITTPLTVGLRPCHLTHPALPKTRWLTSTFPTWPIVAVQSSGIKRTSVEGNLSVAKPPSLAITCAAAPADRAILPP
jgi:hypothetical protein